jgi:hypothetical protein
LTGAGHWQYDEGKVSYDGKHSASEDAKKRRRVYCRRVKNGEAHVRRSFDESRNT